MPNLFIMRHGDAAASAAGDRSRTLSPLGRTQARESGNDLAKVDSPPVHVLASSAPRALETAQIVREILQEASGATVDLHEDPRLYLASAETMRGCAEDLLGERPENLLLVAHQPGCGELVGLLCDGQATISGYPFRTAGVRRVELLPEGLLLPGSARLTLEI